MDYFASPPVISKEQAICCVVYFYGGMNCGNSKPSPCAPWGDINSDGVIDSSDSWVYDRATDKSGLANADVDNSGIADNSDIKMINNYLNGSIGTFTRCPALLPLRTVTMKPMANLISSLINALLAIAAGLVVLFLIIGGIKYIRSWGEAEDMEMAKKILFYAVLGLIVILVSYSAVVTLDYIING